MTKLTGLPRPLTVALALTAAVVLASCSRTDSPVVAPTTGAATSPDTITDTSAATRAVTTSPTSPAPSPSASRRIDITVTGKRVTPAPAVVNLAVGESLTIAVTSDHNDRLHAHGFNIDKAINAGQRLEITVKGAQTGVYEIELHRPALRILQVAVR